MLKSIKYFLGLFFIFNSHQIIAQISRDSITHILESSPSFTIYKDNYAITGIPLNEYPNNKNSDVKLQISFRQRLTNAVLPFNSFLFLTYTQVSFWDFYVNSRPFRDINFNPGIGWGKLLFKDKSLNAGISIMVEHQSNGKDGIASRGWNNVSLNYMSMLGRNMRFSLKAWVPFQYKDNNPDLMEYIGYGEAKFTWLIWGDRLIADVFFRKGASWSWKGSVQAQLSYKPFKAEDEYLFLQFWDGYAESLLEYKQYSSMIRIGIAIKPFNFNFY